MHRELPHVAAMKHCLRLTLITLILTACRSAETTSEPAPQVTAPTMTDRAATEAARLRDIYAGPQSGWPAPHVDADVVHVELGRVDRPARATDPRAIARIELGQTLFFDARLSGTGQMACASCHDAELGWADGRATSFGHGFQPLPRNAPSLLNVAFGTSFFWDGRAASLEDQALAVFENANEMHSSMDAVLASVRSSRGYREQFKAAWNEDLPTLENTLRSIAAFERTLVSDGSSAFDDFLGGKRDALSDAAVRGLHLFRTEARCVNCHNGPLLTDGKFHDLGLSYYGRKLQDLGRYEVTRDPADVGRFKTPSLRNVMRTGPYMHNGLFDIDGVLNMYSAGMVTLKRKPEQADDPLFPTKSPHLKELGLDAQKKGDLAAFMDALTERRRRVRPPAMPALGDAGE
ncbi:MAG: cytochrome-c peroxidase [Planctomycetes bacterium]|nr:cytochrome-c peroxidase [Planctomycetota bacterium]